MPKGDKSTASSRKSTHNRGAKNDSAKLNPAKRNLDSTKDANAQKRCKIPEKGPVTETPTTPKKRKKNLNIKGKTAPVSENSAPDDPKAMATTMANFCEEDNFVEFEVSGETDEFLSDVEMRSEHSEVSSDEDDSEIILSQNNNANIEHSDHPVNAEPDKDKVSVKDSFTMMQDFLIHKGVLSNSMSEDDMNEFLKGVELG